MTDQMPKPEDQSETTALLRRVVEVAEDALGQFASRQREERRWQIVRRTCLTLIGLMFIAAWVKLYAPILGLNGAARLPGVAVVPIAGDIGGRGGAQADLLVPQIRAACENPQMEALVLRIASPGGSPTEAERIVQSLDACRQPGKSKPVIAVIEEVGASAAYMVAVHADRVVANRYALVGSIGAVMRSLDASGAAARFGVVERVYASGPLKAGNGPLTRNTSAQDRMTQSLVDDTAAMFRDEVVAARGKRLKSTPDLFSGRVWVGPQALSLGLIDEVGTYEQVMATRFKGRPVNDYAPHPSLEDRLGLQAMLESAIERVWARASTPQLQ